jgi:hypothetical protein
MDEQIITIYCLCDDLLQAQHHYEDPQCTMSDAEVMTTALVAARFFKGNLEQARIFLKTYHYVPRMLSRSRLIRRLHRIRSLFLTLFDLLGETWKALNTDSIYSVDSFPIATCDNYRIRHAKLYRRTDCRGYLASKQRYFYGLKVHLLVTQTGQPVEFFLTPGAWSDVGCLESFDLDLRPHSVIYADRGYTNYHFEDALLENSGIHFMPMRKRNSKRQFPPWIQALQHYFRKRIETVGSLLQQLLPKSIHAVKAAGFELKVVLFILTLSINCL